VADDLQVDVIIETIDADVVASIHEDLSPLRPEPADATRELVTILTIAAGAVTLATKLVELWKKLKAKPNPPAITIEVQSGATLNLGTVQAAEEIERFIAAGSESSAPRAEPTPIAEPEP
jgi:hypothetical protein